MAKSCSLTGSDVVKINNRIFNDLADGDAATLSYPNDLAVVKTGKTVTLSMRKMKPEIRRNSQSEF